MKVVYYICEGCNQLIPVKVDDNGQPTEVPGVCPHCDFEQIQPTKLCQELPDGGVREDKPSIVDAIPLDGDSGKTIKDYHLIGIWCNDCQKPFYVLDTEFVVCPYCGSDDLEPVGEGKDL